MLLYASVRICITIFEYTKTDETHPVVFSAFYPITYLVLIVGVGGGFPAQYFGGYLSVPCSLTATAAHGLSEYALRFSSTNRPTKHIL